MENISDRILMFHELYLVCLAGTIVFLAVSVILFICLDIWNVVVFLTGWKAKREIRKMETKTALLCRKGAIRVERNM